MFAVDRTCESNFRRASSKQEALFESVGTWTSTSYFSKACDRAWPVGKNLAAIAVDKGTSNQMSCRRYLSSEIPCLESTEVSCNARAISRQSASTVFLSRSFKPSLASESIDPSRINFFQGGGGCRTVAPNQHRAHRILVHRADSGRMPEFLAGLQYHHHVGLKQLESKSL